MKMALLNLFPVATKKRLGSLWGDADFGRGVYSVIPLRMSLNVTDVTSVISYSAVPLGVLQKGGIDFEKGISFGSQEQET